ncbi:HAD domain-containing protein [Cupriavidus sp. D39]|uniref:HAD domain-containing protein n=1 Tax=Cupriavidus sp. D39 TaxID=2997877 RepID=UPI002271579C|nr:HAD domain-containing protein [Cupriavidus sp. D39]MCY0857539.1 HAD domain-containing protein [Cupriavidus sp. D39]
MTHRPKFLFLDFDGVLHPVSALDGFAMRMAQDAAISYGRLFRWTWVLEESLEGADVNIVVHSSWRRFLGTAQLLQYLGPLANRYCGIANLEMSRWQGIRHAASQLELADDEWVVLDDHASQFPDPPPRQLVLCNPESGIWEPRVRERVRAWAVGKQPELECKDDE